VKYDASIPYISESKHEWYNKGMALFIRQDDNRSELQQRLAAELQERAKKRAEVDVTPPDGVTDSQYVKDYKQTTSLAWVWVVIVIAAIAAMVFLIVSAGK
jgi:hypothetical protein